MTLCAAAGTVSAAETDPVSGGLLTSPGSASPAQETETLLASPAPAPAPAAETGAPDDTSWGLLIRGGYFGLPEIVADEVFNKHPKVNGSSYGAEIRYHGEGGGRGVESIGLAIETAKADADGEWQLDEGDRITNAGGEFSMLAITLTGYWSLFPTWYVHPYAGIGIGIAHLEGEYEDETERVTADIWIPVLHVPIGLAVELGKHLQLAIEGRFIDGIAVGGALQVRF